MYAAESSKSSISPSPASEICKSTQPHAGESVKLRATATAWRGVNRRAGAESGWRRGAGGDAVQPLHGDGGQELYLELSNPALAVSTAVQQLWLIFERLINGDNCARDWRIDIIR